MTPTLESLAERALRAPSLLRLWDAVEAYADACDEQGVTTGEGGLDLVALPTFGGEDPDDVRLFPTLNAAARVRSWDPTHILIDRQFSEHRFVIVPRSVYAA